MYHQAYTPQNQGNPQSYPQSYSGYPQGNPAWYAPPPQQQPTAAPRRSGNGNGGSNGGNGHSRSSGNNGKRKKKPSLKWQLIKVLLVLIVLTGAGIGGYILKTQSDVRPYTSVFLPNISVDGISLSGMTWEEGSQAVWAQANAKSNSWYVRLKNSAGQYNDITASMLGISFDPTAALEQAWAIGHETSSTNRKDIFQLKEEIEQAQKTTYEFSSAQQSANTAPIDEILYTIQTAAYKAPQDAVMLGFNPDDTSNPFTFQQEVYGQRLDTTAVKEQILEMVNTLQSGEVLLETTSIAPNVTVEQLEKNVELRFRATTPISKDSSENRTNNIRVAFEKINGLVLEDGKKFSFNDLVGRRTIENGFYPAIEYAYGLEVEGIGGGVCQASTTVYLAAIQSGLEITSRKPHSNPVSYTDPGLDATVSDTRGREIDFAFRNDSGGPIYITAHVISSGTSSKNLLCEVRIYGKSLENVSYTLQAEVVETIPKPEEPTLVEDETGEHVVYQDETERISKGRDGYVVETYLVTVVDGQQANRELVSRDTFDARADRYWVGVTPRY